MVKALNDDILRQLEAQRMAQMQQQQAQQPQQQQGGKGFWLDLLSAGTGAGGALGGAAMGASLGSVVPGVGTAVGGILGALLGGGAGSAAGEVAENAIMGEDLGKNVGREALLGGVTSLPITAGLKLARAGGKALAGKAGAKDLIQEAGVQTIGKRTVARGGAYDQAFDDNAIEALRRLQGGRTGDVTKTSLAGRLETKGTKALADQYGTLRTPEVRQLNPAQTVRELADIGITKPQDAERMANAITGADGILNKQVVKAVGNSKSVDTSGMRNVFNDALDNFGVVEGDRKKLEKIFLAEMNKMNGGARGSLGNANPTDTLSTIKSLEKRIADLRGKGGNYRMTTPEREDMANALQLVRDELEDRLYLAAGGNKNLQKLMTPELREQLVKLAPNNRAWVNHVDNNIMKATDIGQIRSFQRPFVSIKKIIEAGDANAFTAGGRIATSGQGIREALVSGAANMVANPVRRGFARGTRMLDGVGGGGGAVGQSLAGATTRQGIVDALTGISDQPQAEGLAPQTPEELAALQAQAGAPGMDAGVGAPTEQAAEPSVGGYTKSQIEDAMVRAAMDGNNEALAQLKVIYDLLPQPAGMDLDSSTARAVAQSDNAASTIDQLEQLYSQAGGGQGPIGGQISSLMGNLGLNNEARTYNDLARGSVAQIARAMGETGTISDADVRTYSAMLPRLTDPPEVAQAKIAALRERLMAARQNTLFYGAGAAPEAVTGQAL